MSTLGVYWGSYTGLDPAFADTARNIGAEIAGAGHDLVYGGGEVGLMKVVADTALAKGPR